MILAIINKTNIPTYNNYNFKITIIYFYKKLKVF